MTKAELARALRVTTRTIESWVGNGTLQKPLYIGRRALWPKEAIVALLKEKFSKAQDGRPDVELGD